MRARSRDGVAFDAGYLTVSRLVEWLSGSPACECCGRKLSVSFRHDGKKHDDVPSVDRFDPAFGYVAGNVSLLCWRCNRVKGDATAAELECVAAWMRRKVARSHLAAPAAPGEEQADLFAGAAP